MNQPAFYTPSTFKLAVMSITTFGIYPLYWFYRNWVTINLLTNQNFKPFWRAFYAPLWVYSCYGNIIFAAQKEGISFPPVIDLLAFLYIFFVAMLLLSEPYSYFYVLSFTSIIPINRIAYEINKHRGHENFENSNFTILNLFGILGGVILFALSWNKTI